MLARIDGLENEVKILRLDFQREKKSNRNAHQMMWIGIVAALVAGLASN